MRGTIRAGELPSKVGQELEPSSWLEISQERVDRFADATDDHQFIHVDPERAARTPFGGTIAHGFLTLSLLPRLTAEKAPAIEGAVMGLNYGADKLRFMQPVRVGSRIRARQQYLEATEKRPGQWLLRMLVTVEIEHEAKPALVAETLAMFYVA
ncbi:MAG: MaoC family dehydratase [Lysobacterales bacterium]|nr:MAG: MaoC family dehydratase [Xanthomonadales bacterium]